jgi:putative FmdB family regulatory protein
MPIFEYACLTCNTGKRFSALVGVVADAPAPTCPVCQSEQLRKTVSRFNNPYAASDTERVEDLLTRVENLDESDAQATQALTQEVQSLVGE